MTTTFPLHAPVVLHGLVKAPDLNGKVGVVRSGLMNGRQRIYVEELSKEVALKVSNLKYQSRTVDSLSVKELKLVLKAKKNLPDSELTGIDKSELQSKVQEEFLSSDDQGEEIAEVLARAQAPKPQATSAPSTTTPMVNPSQAAQAANQLANMSPEQLRQQARMMRSMDPDSIRRMNPQLAMMSNDQIRQAADQMEMMANNPHMMKMATEQMKNMSPQEIQRMQAQVNGGNMPSAPSSTFTNRTNTPSSNTAAQAQQAANMMSNMTPEQMKQQAEMLKTMDPDSVRRMNPQLAHMSDDQIKMAASQFEMMASNPGMMKMAMDQMKNMTPEQVEAMRNGNFTPPDMSQMGGDPAQMLANMDKNQLKQMLKSLKENPEMMKQFTAMSGLKEEQLMQGVDMFANMDDDKLDAALAVMAKAQKAKEIWSKANAKTGGHLKKIVIGSAIFLVFLFVKWLFFSGGGSNAPVDPILMDTIPNIATPADEVEENEFDSEF